MATFDQLSAEQRAIIELVLKQGQSYDQLGDTLGMPTSRVRELARDALVRLSPVSAAAVDDDWRGQVGDYLLNQQSGPESTATRGHLRHSEAARGWSRSVLDSLHQFYRDGTIPEIPEGEAAPESRRQRKSKEPKEAKPAKEPRRQRELSPGASATVRRRRIIGIGALAAIVLFGVLAWPGKVLLFKDDDEPKKASSNANAAAPKIVGQLVLRPQGNQGRNTAGIAVIAERGGERQLIVQAQLPANKDREAYEVWLYNSKGDARSLGAQVTDQQGTFQGAGPLPDNFERFRFIDVSREKVDQERGHSGTSILRGRIDQIQAPPQNTGTGQGDQTAPQQTTPQGTTTTP
jgi:anti-sigma-K factor RskA/sigma-70-like protein